MTFDMPLQPSFFHVLRKQVAKAGSLGWDRIHASRNPNFLVVSLQRGGILALSVPMSQGSSRLSSRHLDNISHLFAKHSILECRKRKVLLIGPMFYGRQLDHRGHATCPRHVAMWRQPSPVFLFITALVAGEIVALVVGSAAKKTAYCCVSAAHDAQAEVAQA